MRVNTLTKVKIVVAALAVILVAVVILQNTESVETRLLFVTVEMPRAMLLFLALLIGFGLGLASALMWGSRKKPAS